MASCLSGRTTGLGRQRTASIGQCMSIRRSSCGFAAAPRNAVSIRICALASSMIWSACSIAGSRRIRRSSSTIPGSHPVIPWPGRPKRHGGRRSNWIENIRAACLQHQQGQSPCSVRQEEILKYNQPYGISDPNGSYINGNPATGQMGSIPPAESIEYPQREIVNLIASAALAAPANTDLKQLAKAVQSSRLLYGADAGTSNAYQITLNPAPDALVAGMMFLVKIGNANTGPSVLNVNGLGPKPIVHHDGTDLRPGELAAGAMELFAYDGVKYELAWSGISSGAGPIYLTNNADYYINAGAGNDSWDGLSAVYSSGIHGPFKTLQRAANEVPKYNLNNWNMTMHVANGA